MAQARPKRDMSLPQLPPAAQQDDSSSSIIPRDQFTRKRIKDLHNFITQELKKRGTKTPHVFLPFRLRVDDQKLERFLATIFPNGQMIDTLNESATKRILAGFDEFTLICGLKYLWCRLPNLEIIGWDNYLHFKRLERENGYPKDAFLRLMPKCVSTRAHASIVYDFLDLLVSIASYSQYNYLSGRKISKMASMWAFNSMGNSKLAFYDATAFKENSFISGLELWKKTCIGLFHLFLAFLRAMMPDNEDQLFKGPKSLQSLLSTNSYPPPENLDSIKSVITIPCVHVKTTRRSSDPYALITKIRQNLKFDRKDEFVSVENYTILKNIFLKDSTNEIISTLTDESRRILTRISDNPIPSNYDLYPGWTKDGPPQDPDIPLFSEISITNVTLQDYYIWTWLSSLASDQSSYAKALFGRSIVVEAGLRGFQKWLILTETSISPDEYISRMKGSERPRSKSPLKREKSPLKDLPPPPGSSNGLAPPTVSKNGLLPEVSFQEEPFGMEQYTHEPDHHHHHHQGKPYQGRIGHPKPADDYSQYMRGLNDDDHMAQNFNDLNINKQSGGQQRPRPPPLDLLQQEQPLNVKKVHKKSKEPNGYSNGYSNGHFNPDHSEIPQEQYPQEALQYSAAQDYREPYDNYTTLHDRLEEPQSTEPFDNYYVPSSHHVSKPKEAKAVYDSSHKSPRRKHQDLPPAPMDNRMQDDYSGMSPASYLQEPPVSYSQEPPASHDPYLMPTSRVGNSSPHQAQEIPHAHFGDQYQHYQENHLPPQKEFDNSQFPAQNGEAIPDKPKKKKKKKKSKPKDDFAIPIDQLPEGPPPPLPAELSQQIEHQPQNGDYNNGPGAFNSATQPPPPPEKPETKGLPRHIQHPRAAVKDHQPHEHPLQQSIQIPPHDKTPGGTPSKSSLPKGVSHHNGFSLAGRSQERLHSRAHEAYTGSPPKHGAHSYMMPQNASPPRQNDKNQMKIALPSNSQPGHQMPPDPSPTYSNGSYNGPQSHSPSHHQSEPYPQLPPTHIPNTQRLPPQENPTDQLGNQRSPTGRGPSPTSAYTSHSQPRSHHSGGSPSAQTLQGHMPQKHMHQDPMAHGQMPHQPSYSGSPMHQQPHGHMMSPQTQYASPAVQHMPPQGQQMAPPGPMPRMPSQQMPQQMPMQHQMMPQQQMMPPGQPYYYPPPPPQGYYPPPQGYGYPPQPMYYPPPPQGYYGHPPPQQQHKPKPKPTTSELTMMGMPSVGAKGKNKPQKANLRAALNKGEFGI